ncbi:hypothetical protein A4A49_52156 [Nicotiana attenuata]|uniref:Reverse transcriptase zinc-binding domain-containing protein n=1 Tax=Nicotiana attenuata TaxID=49451 RepID=A0A314L785_NICAT|nr:hypothetical protein A4A49_52156 [Nicotiana attenuata]
MDVAQSCPLCNSGIKSISHLFFQCDYAAYIWNKILFWQGVNRKAMDWSDELKWPQEHAKGRSSEAEVYRIALAASISYVWRERNQRVFQDKYSAPDLIIKQIIQEVCCRGSMKPRLARKLEMLELLSLALG